MLYYYNPYELYHHGIKGQKWGVRRFQNPDGTLTRAGQLRLDTKAAKKDYKRAAGDYNAASYYNNMTGGVFKADRERTSRFADEARSKYRSYIKTKNEFKYEKAKEKGKSEEKLERIKKKGAKQEAVLDAREKVTKAISDSYAQQSSGRVIVNNILSSNGYSTGLTSKTSVAALQSVGYTKAGARAVSILLGSGTATSMAYSKAERQAKREFEKNYNREDKDEDN